MAKNASRNSKAKPVKKKPVKSKQAKKAAKKGNPFAKKADTGY